jgi:type VI secretion system secreted protein VgrG
VAPWLWFLTQTANCRIFQEKTTLQIIEQIFNDFGFSDYEIGEVKGVTDKWNYCVQYRETAFDFISRLMEDEGIFYFFRHENNKHVLVLGNQPGAHKNCPVKSTFRMVPGQGRGANVSEDSVSEWEHHYEFRPGKWAQTDYNFETPSTSLLVSTGSVVQLDGISKFEVFDFPGEYEMKPDGEKLNKIRMQEEEVAYSVVRGSGNCRPFSPGLKFSLEKHERPAENGTYVLTSVTHSARQTGFFGDDGLGDTDYSNSFTCIPVAVPYRPSRTTSKPIVHGTQTAVVTGPPGEEIYTDKYGRVKVQFHWDREGRKDDKTSCWIRVAQPWAGKQWGAIWIPRIGQEVVVAFLEGDPDRPLIVGSVYNAEQMPPYELTANKTQSGIKSRSSMKGGAADFNELRFEDKKGSEDIYFHAQKDFHRVVENDDDLKVGHDQTIEIKNHRTEVVKEGDEKVTIEQGKRSVFVNTGDDLHQVKTGNRDAIIDMGNDSITVKMGNHMRKINLGKSETEAMQSITLKVGANSIVVDQSGITLDGIMIKLKGQAMIQSQAPMQKMNGDAMVMIKGGITMIN